MLSSSCGGVSFDSCISINSAGSHINKNNISSQNQKVTKRINTAKTEKETRGTEGPNKNNSETMQYDLSFFFRNVLLSLFQLCQYVSLFGISVTLK